ncbi:GNAT family N-acetyltransferase [Allokutzneria sp. A3M-2-11 16]|uniref:GNAT family N-acetyltransferase n=1 Tax=Allokutzneria sp. A3M-2-11 16 TaxID=2962043 RepID=UPI0020B84630|nr:GNAT family protein [Allokutzneria sp. A3M-2-11 16]MCP3798626.1 GNAT family N-acetyltransferase [Allokutzneria sp. A3M-2-11 16]
MITTERLVLRVFQRTDADDVWAYQRLPEVSRHMRWEPRGRGQVRDAVERLVSENELREEGDCLSLAVVLTGPGTVIGQVELVWRSKENRQGEIGYILNPAYQGKGFATEAARAALRYGFEELDLYRIVGRCSARNTASANLLARLGMRREAHFIGTALDEDGWREEYVFAMVLDEWRARSAPAARP